MGQRGWTSRRFVAGAAIVFAAALLVAGGCSSAGNNNRGPGRSAASTASVVAAGFRFDRSLAQANLDEITTRFGATAAIFAISVHGQAPTILTSGVWDTASHRPVRPDDAFYIASLTKTFVGALVLNLVDAQKIRLDDLINAYGLGWPNGDRMTVRDLLAHTSGLPPLGGDLGRPDQYAPGFAALVTRDPNHRFSPTEVLSFVRDRPLLFAPGTKTSYTNIDTILAAQIVEHVTGEPLVRALHDRLLAPLGLTSTRYAPDEAVPLRTIPQLGAGVDDTALLSALGPAGAMVSDARDLIAWGRAFLRDGTILTPATHRLATTIGAGGTGLGTIGWGRSTGLCVFNQDGCPNSTAFFAYGGSGSMPGVRSIVLYDSDNDTVIVAFANNQAAPAAAMAPLTWFGRPFPKP